MEGLSEISGELTSIVEKTAPSVVRVEARRRMPGSGIVWAADGTIVTADHIIEREDDLRVGFADGSVSAATLVGRDPTTDVAVVRAQASGLALPAWSEGERAKVGQLVVALGRPGRTVRARLGMISALGDAWRAPAGGELARYLEADVAIRVGFSGGPLVDTAGAVLGMNTAGLLRDAALTVPVATLRKVVSTLLTHGRIRRGYLGVGAHPVRLPEAWRQGQETGLLVVSVESGSPADRGGVVIGDVIVSAGGKPVRFHNDLQGYLTPESVGTAVRLRLVRGGEGKDLNVTVGERPAR